MSVEPSAPISLLASLPHNNPRPVLLVSCEGTTLYANPAAERLRQEVGAESLTPLLPAQHRETLRASCNHSGLQAESEAPVVVNGRRIDWTYRFDPEIGLFHLYADLDASGRADSQRLDALQSALDNGELAPHFQPIVRSSDGRLAGFEALVRWPHAGGSVSPGDFVPLAERTGLVQRMDALVLEAAIGMLAHWQRQQPRLSVSINVSAKTLAAGHLPETVGRALERHQVAPHTVCLELTESSLLTDVDVATRSLHELKEHGVRIALDDFGTGYASLTYLHQFPIDRLKIDRSFINQMLHRERTAHIVTAIVALAKPLGLDVVAEGLETCEQAVFMRDLACQYLQGYYYGAALDPDKARALLHGEPLAPCPAPPETARAGGSA